MRMYYIGIFGALNPVAQKVISLLEDDSSPYGILFVADGNFAETDVQAAQFKSVQEASAHNLTPDLVLDFGSTEDAFERAKYYRAAGIPAIMQGVLFKNELEKLHNLYRKIDKGNRCAPLVIMPDYAVVKMQLMNNLKAQISNFSCDVHRIYVQISHNTDKLTIRRQWLWWTKQLNCLLDDYSEYFQENNSDTIEQFLQGHVRVTSHKTPTLDTNEEMLRVVLALSDNKGLLKWESYCSLLESRVEGALTALDWFFDSQNNSQELLLGDVVIADFILDT